MDEFVNPGHYRDPAEEQSAWQLLHTQRQARDAIQAQVTPEVAQAILDATRQYPWLDAGVVVSLARAKAPPQVFADAARIAADANGRH